MPRHTDVHEFNVFYPNWKRDRSLARAIHCIFESLAVSLNQEIKKDDLLKLITQNKLCLKNSECREDDIDITPDFPFAPGYDAIGEHLKMAIQFIAIAELALEEKTIEPGWSYLVEASICIGVIRGITHKEVQLQRKAEHGAKGGLAHAGTIKLAKLELARLIQLHEPPEGWESATQVADTLHSELETYIVENQIPLKADAVHTRITSWIRSDEGVKQAYKTSKTQA